MIIEMRISTHMPMKVVRKQSGGIYDSFYFFDICASVQRLAISHLNLWKLVIKLRNFPTIVFPAPFSGPSIEITDSDGRLISAHFSS